jgi:hypothetical protein
MIDVFISYKQEEREAVQIIASTLIDLKVSVWFDTRLRAGASFDEEIAAALDAAKAVLVCWTPAAIQSEWVRGEATQGMQRERLAACILQPTNLIPPFNLTHAENLCAWAGQDDDPAWLKLLERIGELTGRPGLTTYTKVMRVGASAQDLKAWATGNGADPLVETVWSRVALLEGEGSSERLARERAEARIADERRKALAEKSRRLARERGLRDPAAERRRFRLLVASVAVVALVSIVATAYIVDSQDRDRILRDNANSISDVRSFISHNAWHPIADRAREKLARLDLAAWNSAQTAGTVEALEGYLTDARPDPEGLFVAEAEQQLETARHAQEAQRILSRLLLYRGPVDGATNEDLQRAVWLFRYRWNMPVSSDIDAALMERLNVALLSWIHPQPDDLRALISGPPTENDYARLASEYRLDGATIRAVSEVVGNMAFAPDGRPIILFEPRIFSRLTYGRFDATHPHISSSTSDQSHYPTAHDARWDQLKEAHDLDPEAAYGSASYGRMQIMGFQSKTAGFETAGEYVRFMSQSEANQIEAMLRLSRHLGVIDELQRHDWAGFARRFSGPNYSKLKYDIRLAEAYARISAEMAAEYDSVLPNGMVPLTATP